MQKLEFVEHNARPIPLGFILLGAFLIHAPLLLMKLPLNIGSIHGIRSGTRGFRRQRIRRYRSSGWRPFPM